jgi:hypothetical protein
MGSSRVCGLSVASRRRVASIVFLALGLLVALYLGTQAPQEQHVRIVLGSSAPEVRAVGLQYLRAEGDAEVMREVHFTYEIGAAPRIIPHEPKLPNGDYRLQIDIDAHDGRRSVQRRVTLGGGSTQIDISSALARDDQDH